MDKNENVIFGEITRRGNNISISKVSERQVYSLVSKNTLSLSHIPPTLLR